MNNENKSIKETLNLIRKALEEEPINDDNEISRDPEEILLLNKLVDEDGTIDIIENNFLNKDEVKKILDKNISKYFEKKFDNWLDKNASNYFDKYINKK